MRSSTCRSSTSGRGSGVPWRLSWLCTIATRSAEVALGDHLLVDDRDDAVDQQRRAARAGRPRFGRGGRRAARSRHARLDSRRAAPGCSGAPGEPELRPRRPASASNEQPTSAIQSSQLNHRCHSAAACPDGWASTASPPPMGRPGRPSPASSARVRHRLVDERVARNAPRRSTSSGSEPMRASPLNSSCRRRRWFAARSRSGTAAPRADNPAAGIIFEAHERLDALAAHDVVAVPADAVEPGPERPLRCGIHGLIVPAPAVRSWLI